MSAGYLYLWDSTAGAWVKALGDSNGKLVIDPSIKLPDHDPPGPAAPEGD